MKILILLSGILLTVIISLVVYIEDADDELLDRMLEENVHLPDSAWFVMRGDTAVEVHFTEGFCTDTLCVDFFFGYADSTGQNKYYYLYDLNLCFRDNKILIPFDEKIKSDSILNYKVDVLPVNTSLYKKDENGAYFRYGRYIYLCESNGRLLAPNTSRKKAEYMIVHLDKYDSVRLAGNATLKALKKRFRNLLTGKN